jgi:hypothetical protein
MGVHGYIDGYMHKQAVGPAAVKAARRVAKPAGNLLRGVPESKPVGSAAEGAKRVSQGAKMDRWYPHVEPKVSLWDRLKALDPGRKASQAAQDAREFATYQRNRLMGEPGPYGPHTTATDIASGRASAALREKRRARNLQLLANTQRAAAGGSAGAVVAGVKNLPDKSVPPTVGAAVPAKD